MVKKNVIINKLKEFKNNLSKEIPIHKMILFGSRVTGKTHKYSDVDLVIVSKKFKRKKSYARALGFFKYWNLDLPVDFLCYTPEEFKKLCKMVTIVRQAVREGIVI